MPTTAVILGWLWQTTWQTCLLAAVVAAVTWALRKRLSPQASQLLWMLVFLRAVMPVLPGSPLSLYGLLESEPVPPAAPVVVAPIQVTSVVTSSAMTIEPAPEIKPPFTFRPFLLAGWALGGVSLLAAVTISTFAFSRRLKRATQPAPDAVASLVRQCADELKLAAPRVMLTDLVATPAIFSAVRPVLLIPKAVATQLPPADLRSVILHELEHVRRHHLKLEWALMLIRAVHWFNPAMWWAHRQIRASRELICDQAVLARLDAPTARQYGLTMLQLAAGRLTTPRAVPMAAFAKQHKLLRQRIEAIAGGKGRYIAGLGVVVAVVLSASLLTRPSERPAKMSSSLPATRSSQNITQLVSDARSLVEQQRYEEALGAIDVILKFDPNNDYALGARPLVEDRAIVAQQRRYRERLNGNAVANAEAEEKPVPYSDAIRYPQNWPDLPAPRARSTTEQAAADAAAMKVLEQQLPQVRFDNVGFADVVDFLRDVSGASIFVNWRSIEAGGIDRNWPVTARLRDVKFSKALETVLRDVGGDRAQLGFVVEDGVITISTLADLSGPATQPATQPAAAPIEPQAANMLDRPVAEMIFDNVGFADVLNFLHDGTGINFSPDWAAMRKAGIDRDTPVTAHFKGEPVKTVLDTLLRIAGGKLGYKVDQGVVTITTAQELEKGVTHAYDVRDLVEIAPAKDRAELLKQVMTLIQDTVANDSWKVNGGKIGSIRESAGQLIIEQTTENHQQITRLLEQLRETRAIKIHIVAQLLEIPADKAAELRKQHPNPTPAAPQVVINTSYPAGGFFIDDFQVKQLVAASTRTLTSPPVTIVNGQGAAIDIAADDKSSAIKLEVFGTVSADRKYVTITAGSTPNAPTTAPAAGTRLIRWDLPKSTSTIPDGATLALTQLRHASFEIQGNGQEKQVAIVKGATERWIVLRPTILIQREGIEAVYFPLLPK